MIDQNKLKELFDYEPETGNFIRKNSNKIAGCLNSAGYVHVKIKNKTYKAHRLAWVYVNGDLPDGYVIDHVNHVRDDNRIDNLRIATVKENNRNLSIRKDNNSGIKGIHWKKNRNKWCATCTVDRKKYHVGYFTDISDAEHAVKNFRETHHGDFSCHC